MTNQPPMPVHVVVCASCHQPWEHHTKAAKRRLEDSSWDEDVLEIAPISDDEVFAEINLYDCIDALKIANRGPEGPPGVTGPMGMKGDPA